MIEADESVPSGMQLRSIRWVRTIALACALAFAVDLIAGIWQSGTDAEAQDFVSFWAAGKLTVNGHAAQAYDVTVHNEVERTVAPLSGVLPFPYPPPFLFFVMLFGFTPYWLSYALWVCASSSFYLAVSRYWMRPSLALTQPAPHVNVLLGQTGLLTSSIFLLGLAQLPRRPVVAGAVLGLLIIKPQVFLLLPIALLASRQWKAIFCAIGSASLVLGAALFAFGAQTYVAFLALIRFFGGTLNAGGWDWSELASVYSFVRWLGVSAAVAYGAQGVTAILAAVSVWRAWRIDHSAKAAILGAGTLLVPPYLFAYDTLLLILPIAWLVQTNRYKEAGAVWLICALSLLTYFQFYRGPNLMPAAALLSLWFLTRPGIEPSFSTRPESDGEEPPWQSPHTQDLS